MTYPTQGYANPILAFDYKPGPRLSLLLQGFTDNTLNDFDIAAVDLNDDGSSEFILRPSNCSAHSLCSYDILAETDKRILQLGTVKAKKLLLGQDYTHGIRNLLAFNTPDNDFAYDLYSWNAQETRYMLRK